MFTHQALPDAYPTAFVNQAETSEGRVDAPLASAPSGPYTYAPPDTWGNQLVYEPIAGDVNMAGFGEAAQPAHIAAPQLERPARFFVTYFYHQPYQGAAELRENVGGHVVIRRMPNAGQAQGGLQPLSTGQYQPNQRRTQPPAWDAGAFID